MRHCIFPALLLLAILSFSLLSGRAIQQNMEICLEKIETAHFSSAHENREDTARATEDAYAAWQSHQTYLHIVCHRETLNSIESLFRCCLILSRDNDNTEFLVNSAELISQLRALAEMESFSLKHVL